MAYVIYGSKEGPGPYIWFPDRNLMIPLGLRDRTARPEEGRSARPVWEREKEPVPVPAGSASS